jgi:hypothetical protein
METVDDEIRDLAIKFIEKAKADNKPFFGDDGNRVSADAKGCEFQPRRREGENRGGPGGSE